MRRWQTPLAAAVLASAVFLIYRNSLGVPFQFDDEPAVRFNTTIRDLARLPTVLHPPADGAGVTGRPLVNLSLAVNYALGGLEVRGYHLMNVALHLLAALTLWGVLRRTLAQAAVPALCREHAPSLAASITLLWAVHPLLTESVVCVVQRNEVLASLFYLLTLYGFIRAVDASTDGRDEGSRPTKLVWCTVSVLACLLGAASKEIIATAPLMVWLYDRTFVSGGYLAAWRQRRGFYVALFATWIPLAWLILGADQRAGAVGFGLGVSSWDYLLTQCRALTTYLKLAIWPHPLVVDYGMNVNSLGDVWWRGLIVLAMLAATVWALVRRPAWGFVGAWFFLILSPSSSVVPLTTQTIAEHRMYLPLVAVVVLFAIGLHRMLNARAGYAVAAVAVVLGVLVVQRNRVYASAMTLWEDTVIRAPGNARAHLNFGQTLFKAGRLPEAAAQFEEALRLRPQYAEAHYNEGLVLAALDRSPEAIGHYEKAVQLMPDYPAARNDLGIAYAEMGRTAEAQQQFETAVRVRSDFAGAHFNLANLLLRLGQVPAACEHYEAAVRINGSVMDYQNNLAFALMRIGRAPEAVVHYAAAVRLAPAAPELRLNYALALAACSRLADAVPQAAEALRLKPDFAAAQHYLAEMQADLRRLEAAKQK
jgi:tetratricopeptide (TPR) repeat protein